MTSTTTSSAFFDELVSELLPSFFCCLTPAAVFANAPITAVGDADANFVHALRRNGEHGSLRSEHTG
jgi:hypothetical protein